MSSRLWIYFVLMIPLTTLVIWAWWKYDEVSMKSARKEVLLDLNDPEDPRRQRVRRWTLKTYATL